MHDSAHRETGDRINDSVNDEITNATFFGLETTMIYLSFLKIENK